MFETASALIKAFSLMRALAILTRDKKGTDRQLDRTREHMHHRSLPIGVEDVLSRYVYEDVVKIW